MAFNSRFMKRTIKTYSVPKNEEEILLQIYAFQKLCSFSLQNPSSKNTILLCQKIENLNQLRSFFPQKDPLISNALLDLFNQVQNNENEFLKQNVSVKVLNGFSNVPTKNFQTTKKLSIAIQNSTNPELLTSLIQRIINTQLDTYPLFKGEDKDCAILLGIQSMAELYLKFRKKMMFHEYLWLRQVGKKLLREQPLPSFKNFLEKLPYKDQPKMGNKVVVPELPSILYKKKSGFRQHKFSQKNFVKNT